MDRQQYLEYVKQISDYDERKETVFKDNLNKDADQILMDFAFKHFDILPEIEALGALLYIKGMEYVYTNINVFDDTDLLEFRRQEIQMGLHIRNCKEAMDIML